MPQIFHLRYYHYHYAKFELSSLSRLRNTGGGPLKYYIGQNGPIGIELDILFVFRNTVTLDAFIKFMCCWISAYFQK